MDLKEFREITKDFDENVVIVYNDTRFIDDLKPYILELEYKGYDIINQYYSSKGKGKVGKVIILE